MSLKYNGHVFDVGITDRARMLKQLFTQRLFNAFLSQRVKESGERITLWIAIGGYLAHLGLIVLNTNGVISFGSSLLQNPITAIYTPFSFILIYEVYLLIYFLPKSISYYIGKQYEIITLIVIRRIFKDISQLEMSSDWFRQANDLQFLYDTLTSLVLFGLLFLFYKNIRKHVKHAPDSNTDLLENTERFIALKRGIAALLVPLFVLLAAFSLVHWGNAAWTGYQAGFEALKDINGVFFDECFTVLIVVDVLLLLLSFFHSDQFHKIMRNSGFVISTVLLKISFSTKGLASNGLIVGAVLFGLAVLLIHNVYERWLLKE